MTSRDHMLKAMAYEAEMERSLLNAETTSSSIASTTLGEGVAVQHTPPEFTFPTYTDFAARRAAQVAACSGALYKRLSKEVNEAMSVATEKLPGSLLVSVTFECTELLDLGVDRGKQVAAAAASRLLNDLQPLGWKVANEVYSGRGSNLVFVRILIQEPNTKE